MADSNAAVPVGKEWEQIKCLICGDYLTEPRTIPCLHTFCKQCIVNKIEGTCTFCCPLPLCRSKYSISQGDISSFPPNHAINCLVEIFSKIDWMQKEANTGLLLKETNCSRCDEGSKAVAWCKVPCNGWLCDDCYHAHKRMRKDFASHEFITVEKLVKNPKLFFNSVPQRPKACMTHSTQFLDRYCRTCSCFICHDCTLKGNLHETHAFDIVDKERERVKEASTPLAKLLEQVRSGIKGIEKEIDKIDSISEVNITKIQCVHAQAHAILKQQEEDAIQNVNTIKFSFTEALRKQNDNLKLTESRLVRCKEFCDDAVSTNIPEHFLTFGNLIIARVEDLTNQVDCAIIHPELKSDDMMVKCGDPDEFISGSLCHTSGIPHLPHCSVRDPLTDKSLFRITVALQDINGFSVMDQAKYLEIHINEVVLQNVMIKEDSKGIYHAWFNHKAEETQLLSVYWKGYKLNNEAIKVPAKIQIRDYANIHTNINREVRIIKEYGPNNTKLKWPYLMAKSFNNELIVRDCSTKKLVVFNEKLQYSHTIGGEGSGNGTFETITGIAVDTNGYLYVADCDLHCIQKFNMIKGELVHQFGSEGPAEGQFRSPYGLAISRQDLLFVCDHDNHRIQVFKHGLFFYLFGKKESNEHESNEGDFQFPWDVTLNNYEDLLFITSKNNQVYVFTLSGNFLKLFGNFTDIPFKLNCPTGIYYTPDDHLLICSKENNYVLIFEEDGRFVSAIEGSYEDKQIFSHPCGAIVINNGKIVIASHGTDELVVF